jgi:predicted nuclease of predicted toxin-antitoxin system
MRLLLDENLSHRIATRLTAAGHDVVHVTDVDLADTDDPVIFQWAADHNRIVVTSDADFGTMLALSGAPGPSVILLRSSDHLTPPQQADLIAATLDQVADDLTTGAVASITPERIRIRQLPISEDH